MLICSISDTHNQHRRLRLPAADMLVHAGDGTVEGTESEIMDLFTWLESLAYAVKIFTPGNHDGFLVEPALVRFLQRRFPSVHILVHDEIVVNGIVVFGTPYIPPTKVDWPFEIKTLEARMQKWLQIPEDTQILISHSPIQGTLDLYREAHYGCAALGYRLRQLPDLRLHVFGHVHAGHGHQRNGEILAVNAAICPSEEGDLHAPTLIRYDETARYATIIEEAV